MLNDKIRQAAAYIHRADALIITAGAGIGIDSGLPDFRGIDAFWRAFPPLLRLGKNFQNMATPTLFRTDPHLAWGFYGWRLNSYRHTEPHQGFHLLKQWADSKKHGAFIFTSNVDGQFQKTGFPDNRIIACHGSIHDLQCTGHCHDQTWSADSFMPQIDEQTCRLQNSLPVCPKCGALARPNILMFDDWEWLEEPTMTRLRQFEQWLHEIRCPVIIEIGTGSAIPTMRRFSDRIARQLHAPLIRINPDEAQVGQEHHIGLAMGGLAALQEIALLSYDVVND